MEKELRPAVAEEPGLEVGLKTDRGFLGSFTGWLECNPVTLVTEDECDRPVCGLTTSEALPELRPYLLC